MDLLLTVVLVITEMAQVCSPACNLSQKNGAHQCYGALGETLFLHFPDNSSNNVIKLKKDNVRILHYTGEIKLSMDYVNRSDFFNETFVLNGVIKNDSGDYEIEMFLSDGKLFKEFNMRLDIQVPVSEPVLSYSCQPNQEALVTCISKGDDLKYSWTLNRQILISSEAYNVVKLNKNDLGELTCVVQNKVSSHNSTIDFPACQDVSSQFPFLAVTLATVLCVVTLTVIFALFNDLRKKNRLRRDTSEICNNEEVVYADVKIYKL